MIDFLILYENKTRELEGICLLKSKLEKKGYAVEICQAQYYYKKKYCTKVVLTPFLYSDDDIYKYVYAICGKNNKVINLRWEQIYSKENENNIDCFFYPKGQAKKAIHLCWGEKQSRDLQSCGVDVLKAPVVGPLHLELIGQIGYYRSKQLLAPEFGLDEKKEWILFISSFSNSTFTEQEKNDAISMFGPERVEFIDSSIKSKREILEWLKKLAETNIYEIIYRPHPSEKQDDILKNVEKDFCNFHIFSMETVGQWIYASEHVFNWYSTSAVQSVILRKGNVLLRPFEIPKKMDVAIFDAATKIKGYNELKEFLSCKDNNTYEVTNEFMQYYKLDGISSDRIIEICENILLGEYSCDIDYKQIVNSISIKKRMKYEVLYKIYVPLLKFFSGKGFFKGRTIAYRMVKRNSASKKELKLTQQYVEEKYNE